MAVGGISVTLVFDRSPFISEKRTLWLPWNRFIIVDKVVMQRTESDTPSCDVSSFISPNPIVLPSPLTAFGGSCPERGTIIPELQVRKGLLNRQLVQLLHTGTPGPSVSSEVPEEAIFSERNCPHSFFSHRSILRVLSFVVQ